MQHYVAPVQKPMCNESKSYGHDNAVGNLIDPTPTKLYTKTRQDTDSDISKERKKGKKKER